MDKSNGLARRPSEREPDEPDSVKELRAFFCSEDSAKFRSALLPFRFEMDLATVSGISIDPARFRDKIHIIEKTLDSLMNSKTEEWSGPTSLVGPEVSNTFGNVAYRGRAAGLISFGAVMMAAGVNDPKRFLTNITRAAFGVDPFHRTLGDYLGDYPFDENPPKLPSSLESFQEFIAHNCTGAILSAGMEFSQVADQHPRRYTAASITSINPDHGCAGDEVRISGTGFGMTQPAGVSVMFTTSTGGCKAARVLAWTDTEITVEVPSGVGHGCVGLIEFQEGFGSLAQAADTFAGELETCLGPSASAAAERIRDTAVKVSGSFCPDCSNPAATFLGGIPVITNFSVNGRSETEILPGDKVTVDWAVKGAVSLTIRSVGGILPLITGPLDPVSGTFIFNNLTLPDGTVGGWMLEASNDCGTCTRTVFVVVKGKKAFVLSGGGSKGAFEVGAVRCLHDVAGIRPSIICGTSVGALNAAKLAEGGVALFELERLWRDMKSPADLYIEPNWFKTLDKVLKTFLTSASSSLFFEIAGLAVNFVMHKIMGAAVSAMGVPGVVYTVVTSFYPVITGAIDAGRYISAITQAMGAQSLFDFTPTASKINLNIDPAKVAASGIKLRITTVSLEFGKLRIIDENGTFLDSGFQVPLRDAVKASASIPAVFPPVPLSGPHGTENYVDGGVRENVPVKAAVEAGAHRIYAILLNPTELPFATPFPKIIDITKRAVDIILDEAQSNDYDPFRGFGIPITLIAPTFLIYGPLSVDPGLLAINMDYGYMRAYDEVVAKPTDRVEMRKLSDEITTARVEAWYEEYPVNGEFHFAVTSPIRQVPLIESLVVVRDIKKSIRDKTYQRINLSANNSVPSHKAAWWQEWERHTFVTINASPWDEMITRRSPYKLAAETPPPP